jgi:hypothetical protein
MVVFCNLYLSFVFFAHIDYDLRGDFVLKKNADMTNFISHQNESEVNVTIFGKPCDDVNIKNLIFCDGREEAIVTAPQCSGSITRSMHGGFILT